MEGLILKRITEKGGKLVVGRMNLSFTLASFPRSISVSVSSSSMLLGYTTQESCICSVFAGNLEIQE
jgi:hypothetical protein